MTDNQRRNAKVATAVLLAVLGLMVIVGTAATWRGWAIFAALVATLAWGVWRHSDSDAKS
jgi:cytochrome b